jgi:microcin C transport system substrate-binding protein
MKTSRLVTFLLPLVLFGCGGGEPPAEQQSAAADPAEPAGEVVTASETRLVANPPTYDSVPLPEGLTWLTNDEDPTYGAPNAKRGGTYHTYMTGFPLTLRLHGPDAASGEFVTPKRAMFLSLADLHPNTLNFLPSLATHWAFGPDGKTVYYKLDPRARWSDGVPVTADDYVFAREMRLSDFIVDPFGQNHFTNNIVAVVKHDDHTISVVGSAAKPPKEMLYEYGMAPEPRHFHKLDANWVTDYNWKFEPTTGPYHYGKIEKGRYIELERTANWWGDELKYNENRFNVDTIRIDIIRDDNVAFEYFLRGELDSFAFVTNPARWHEKAKGEIFDKGYAGKIEFYTDVPRDPRGLWLNMDDPLLKDKNVRLGLGYSINMQRVLTSLFRGDYQQLRMHYQGYYWGYSHPSLQPLPYDLKRADEYFNAAGWTQRGPDGIRVKDGQRLSVTISYGTDEHTPWLVVLREEAKKAGIELNLQLLDPATWGTQVGEKKYQIVFLRFGVGLTPSFWQAYHSDNAHKPQTNNLTNMDDKEIDALIDQYERASDLETRVRLSHQIQELTRAYAAFIPTYTIPYIRETYWRWMQMPESHGTRISGEIFDPLGAGLFWIDEDIKAETLEARRTGKTFPPMNIVDTTWRAD